MEITENLLIELQRRLKIGSRRGVHLNAIPSNSRYKFDINRLSNIDPNLPRNFIKALLTEQPLKFRVSWKDNVPDLNLLEEDDQTQLVRITKSFENLINQTEAIESEKGINTFGFGFPLLIRRDNADGKLTVAPILIWSLGIRSTREFNTWEITRGEDDPIYLNEVLINHLENDSNIKLQPIPNEMLDDGLISEEELVEICVNLISDINTHISPDTRETFYQKLNDISSIRDKKHYEKLPIKSTNALIDFAGLFSIFEVQKQNIIHDYVNLMELNGLSISLDNMENHSFQSLSSIETDPSQQGILHSLEATRNILIQGPPGTGKSQTLTAILFNALENHKKTIVVCEKRTALEVLHNSLIEKGLGHSSILIKDIIKDRKAVVDSVRDRVDNSAYRRYRYTYSKESLDNIVIKAKKLIDSINSKHKKLDQKLLGITTWTDTVGMLLAELKNAGNEDSPMITYNQYNFSSQEMNRLLDIVQRAQTLYEQYLPLESQPFINPNKLQGSNPYIIEQRINEDFDVYSTTIKKIKKLLNDNQAEFTELRKDELNTQILKINTSVENIYKEIENLNRKIAEKREEYCLFRVEELELQKKSIQVIISEIAMVYNDNKDNTDLYNEKRMNSTGYKLLSLISKKKKNTLYDYRLLVNKFQLLQDLLASCKDISNWSFNKGIAENQKMIDTLEKDIQKISNDFSRIVNAEFDSFNFDKLNSHDESNDMFRAINEKIGQPQNTDYYINKLTSIKEDIHVVLSSVNGICENLKQILKDCKDIQKDYQINGSLERKMEQLKLLHVDLELVNRNFDEKILTEFQQISLIRANYDQVKINSLPILQNEIRYLLEKITSDAWTNQKVDNSTLNNLISDVERLIQMKTEYFNSEIDRFTIEFKWFQYYNSLDIEKDLLNELKPSSNWRKTFVVSYLNSLLIKYASLELPTDEHDHIELTSTLEKIGSEQLKYIREYWFSKQIDATRNFEISNGDVTVENLYNKRSSTRFKRLSLRQIVQADADLFTTFFPIILTSPDVCSNLFKGMNGYFDIVMFDEASQLRLEDNLPAILKGKQVIIAGDEHQMPPSNYFSKVFDGSVEDEDDIDEEDDLPVIDKDNILLSCESLLDFAAELNFEKRYLDFHYRSRHPYLIDFSNHAFYNQRLKPLPNNFVYTPITYTQVNGTFSEHSNEAEALAVLSIIEKNINRLPNGEYPTIGVATFNIAQRNLIKSKILERQKHPHYESFNAKIHELEQNGMFIKT